MATYDYSRYLTLDMIGYVNADDGTPATNGDGTPVTEPTDGTRLTWMGSNRTSVFGSNSVIDTGDDENLDAGTDTQWRIIGSRRSELVFSGYTVDVSDDAGTRTYPIFTTGTGTNREYQVAFPATRNGGTTTESETHRMDALTLQNAALADGTTERSNAYQAEVHIMSDGTIGAPPPVEFNLGDGKIELVGASEQMKAGTTTNEMELVIIPFLRGLYRRIHMTCFNF